ncbi:tetraacyldisaccharide 4'-kinase [Polaromonas sp. SM01]|uniref:tetraacyldisaccharide 4'-kinase n=1 Tax=Polaromonas sp. SM01 TaxID=3085630 RepID=UPI0029825D60|nr:tetraacyldisaccharide 4'-kinase [Polaromonas sp. SM01]MDW5441623.1 tetraacyldisaccharide 4'-kinase [Polaromonas sp. SM01]
MKRLLLQAWLRRGALAWLLWPLAQLFGLLVRLRRFLYQAGLFKSERMPVPVVVVGNVVAGGAGKTPAVIALVQHLQAAGWQAGVVSRGYGRSGQACLEVLPSTPPEASGDEPALIRRATGAPVFVAARRIDAVRALLAAHPATQVVVCDDGLQHYALQRDIEIAVFDERGAGNGWLLPAGPLREPWPARLYRSARAGGRGVDLVLHTGARAAFDGFSSTRRLADHALRADGSRVPLSDLAGQPLLALAGIAKPEAFFDMLRARGLQLAETRALPDHYNFDSYPRPSDKGYTLICTEKDAIKLFPRQANVLAVPLEFSPEPAFFTAFDALLLPLLSPLPFPHGHQTA